MTSKEVKNNLEKIKHLGIREYRETIEQVEKDLEVLEIIKANMTIDDWENVRVKSNDDWNKVMRWLDGKD